MRIDLREYFRDASFGGVKLDDERSRVENLLGKPAVAIAGIDSDSDHYKDAALWFFGGVQFDFNYGNVLEDMGFQPWYIREGSSYKSPEDPVELDTWIFQANPEPDIDDLRAALKSEAIDFQDTGLETCYFDESAKHFVMVDYQPNNAGDEHFGTLVLRSGVSIRYSDDASIVRTAANLDYWMIKGKEQEIVW